VKIIFLDFDGPLVSRQSRGARAWPSCIAALNRITDTTGARIVVSSTWRMSGKSHVKKLLRQWGATGEVVGITPVLESENYWEPILRGYEIAAWLRRHTADSFVIVDDDDDMAHLHPHLIRTPPEDGLTERDADRAIAMLT
jgi:hypothetical protein